MAPYSAASPRIPAILAAAGVLYQFSETRQKLLAEMLRAAEAPPVRERHEAWAFVARKWSEYIKT